MYGWGEFSPEVRIRASDMPGQMAPVVTTIENIYVKISWSYPTDNSDPITEYELLILQSDGSTYTKELTYCDGSIPAIVSNRYCHVPMSVLRSAPFNLPFQAYVVVQARAKNSIGWGDYSAANALIT